MNIKGWFAAAGLAVAMTGGAVQTASATTMYTVAAGDVTVSGGDFCFPGDCTLDGAVTGGSFSLSNVGDTFDFDDLFDWSIAVTNKWATGGGAYTVSVVLEFLTPSAASGTPNSGVAGFVTFLGTLSAGGVDWINDSGSVTFANNHVLTYELHDVLEGGLGTSASSGATFTLAAVPLPAGGLLLIGALGGLGALKRRKAKKAA
ncbi:VPLPA-CTERM sorting domain-containing protein [Frigidibacter sp. ROC022]|uniref:VPLPA-CTERM sorting domain-containing protein n=1 Tax=Frigidibacter sp. ROC022 TaxID=2971796 RepID=UPI00215AE8AE|nr:VPLPA-CTERM sorting domain-containing protein [Frigidibacter sp. ROC022]MCR8726785.1 VPLPA-CTERM sorting domain-containing protein [Frigidibacter sp. ROC022]